MIGKENTGNQHPEIELEKEEIWAAEDLEPCPFCGNKVIYYERYKTEVGMRYRVLCGNCAARIDNGYAQSRYTIRDIWNQRI